MGAFLSLFRSPGTSSCCHNFSNIIKKWFGNYISQIPQDSGLYVTRSQRLMYVEVPQEQHWSSLTVGRTLLPQSLPCSLSAWGMCEERLPAMTESKETGSGPPCSQTCMAPCLCGGPAWVMTSFLVHAEDRFLLRGAALPPRRCWPLPGLHSAAAVGPCPPCAPKVPWTAAHPGCTLGCSKRHGVQRGACSSTVQISSAPPTSCSGVSQLRKSSRVPGSVTATIWTDLRAASLREVSYYPDGMR